ncbi:hypothetical protein HBB16_08745 [Pseudonocardia sp. MCCB 268]|nr:hypothetical protein [Pseudonocardia cytotoxica]
MPRCSTGCRCVTTSTGRPLELGGACGPGTRRIRTANLSPAAGTATAFDELTGEQPGRHGARATVTATATLPVAGTGVVRQPPGRGVRTRCAPAMPTGCATRGPTRPTRHWAAAAARPRRGRPWASGGHRHDPRRSPPPAEDSGRHAGASGNRLRPARCPRR